MCSASCAFCLLLHWTNMVVDVVNEHNLLHFFSCCWLKEKLFELAVVGWNMNLNQLLKRHCFKFPGLVHKLHCFIHNQKIFLLFTCFLMSSHCNVIKGSSLAYSFQNGEKKIEFLSYSSSILHFYLGKPKFWLKLSCWSLQIDWVHNSACTGTFRKTFLITKAIQKNYRVKTAAEFIYLFKVLLLLLCRLSRIKLQVQETLQLSKTYYWLN